MVSFFNDTATTEIYTLSLHDALPIYDKKIVNTESSFTQNKSNFVLANSEGFCDGYKTSSFIASSVTVAKDEKSMERDYEYSSKCFLKDLDDADELGKLAANQTIRKLSPKKIGSE